jgi:hypothetical protein
MNYSSGLPGLLEWNSMQGLGDTSDLSEIEAIAVRKIREKIQSWIESREGNNPDRTTRCRNCGKSANYLAKRTGFVQTRFGVIRYKRAYYVCPHCYQSTCPLDERLNPYKSLARLRTRVAAGQDLPVAELARSWQLGS